jgi:hypothetical protein
LADGCDLPLLGAHGLHRPDRSKRTLQHRAHPTDGCLGPLGGPPDPGHDHQHRHPVQCEHSERHRKEHGVDHRHQHDRADEHEHGVDRFDQAVGADVAQQGGVGGRSGEQVARLEPVQRAHPQPQQPRDQPLASGQHHIFCGAAQQVAPGGVEQRSTDCQPGEQRDRAEQRPLAERVDDQLGDQGLGESGKPSEEAEQPPTEQRPAIGTDMGEQQAPSGLSMSTRYGVRRQTGINGVGHDGFRAR